MPFEWLQGPTQPKLIMLPGVNGHPVFPAFGGIPRADGDIFRIVGLAATDTRQNRAKGDQQEQSDSGNFHLREKIKTGEPDGRG